MKKSVITVSREFGSGGRTVAKLAAEKLGYDFYDNEIILKVVKESGLSQEIVEKYDEYATYKNSFLYSIAMNAGADAYGGMSFGNHVHYCHLKIIKDLAEKGNCVIVGRGGDYILRDRDDCLNVFICADMEFRKNWVLTHYGETDKKIENRLKDKDARRKVFYRSFTMREWGMCSNYHLSLDSGVIGIEKCVDIICDLARGN